MIWQKMLLQVGGKTQIKVQRLKTIRNFAHSVELSNSLLALVSMRKQHYKPLALRQ